MSDEMPPAPVSAPHSGRWKPGQSGNPGGRPKTKPFKDAIERLLRNNPGQEDKIAAAFLAKCETGDVGALREYGDRMDGKVPTAIGGTDDLPPIRGFAWIDPSDGSGENNGGAAAP